MPHEKLRLCPDVKLANAKCEASRFTGCWPVPAFAHIFQTGLAQGDPYGSRMACSTAVPDDLVCRTGPVFSMNHCTLANDTHRTADLQVGFPKAPHKSFLVTHYATIEQSFKTCQVCIVCTCESSRQAHIGFARGAILPHEGKACFNPRRAVTDGVTNASRPEITRMARNTEACMIRGGRR